MPESRSPWPFRALGGLIALAVALFIAFGYDWPDDETEQTSSTGARPAGELEPLAIEEGDAGVDEDLPEATPDEAPTFDPAELAQVLYDGGLPDETPAYYDPTFAPRPDPPPPVEPIVLPQTRRIEPTDPRRAVSRAVFWRGMLDRRIEQIREQQQTARASGDTSAERRATRMLERLESQRPALERRIEELETVVPPGGGEPEEELQGAY